MKFLALTIAIFTSVSSFAADVTYYGVDDDRKECSLTIEEDGEFTFKGGDYEFAALRLPEADQWGVQVFEDLTMDYGKNVYARVIGSPITIGNIGLLNVSGKIVSDVNTGRPVSINLLAKGGLMNWYSNQFVCTELK